MVAKLTLEVSNYYKVVETLTKELNSSKSLLKTVEEFKSEANALLTKMIEAKHQTVYDSGDSDTDIGDDDVDEGDDSEDDISISPKKRKK